MKPFDLSKAKAGAQVTNSCRSMGYYKFTSINQVDGIWHLFSLEDELSEPFTTPDGVVHKKNQFVIITNDAGQAFSIRNGSRMEGYDLSMVPVIIEQWVNIYRNGDGNLFCSKIPYDSYKMAWEGMCEDENQSYVSTVLISRKEV